MKNHIEIVGDHAEIVIRRRDGTELRALIDTEDIAKLPGNQRWSAAWRKSQKTFYATTGSPKSIYLHRLVTDCPPGRLVDHDNFNGLDCRKKNLKICGPEYNALHQRRGHANRYGYRGIFYDKKDHRYRASVKINGHKRYFGSFPTAAMAGAAIDEAMPGLLEELSHGN